jgi:transcription antitermination factor NusG
MMRTRDIVQSFLNHTPISGVLFKHNDYIRVVDGPYAGQAGSLVTVIGLDPEPRFVVELESGADVEIMQSHVEYAGY